MGREREREVAFLSAFSLSLPGKYVQKEREPKCLDGSKKEEEETFQISIFLSTTYIVGTLLLSAFPLYYTTTAVIRGSLAA